MTLLSAIQSVAGLGYLIEFVRQVAPILIFFPESGSGVAWLRIAVFGAGAAGYLVGGLLLLFFEFEGRASVVVVAWAVLGYVVLGAHYMHLIPTVLGVRADTWVGIALLVAAVAVVFIRAMAHRHQVD